jgi:hypothetical protein
LIIEKESILKYNIRRIFVAYAFFAFAIANLSPDCRGDYPSPIPLPASSSSPKPPPGMEGLVWNKWDTDHFVVVSLDKSEGLALKSQVEELRASLLKRWGIEDRVRFKCKLICVPDSKMLKRLFGLSEPKFELLAENKDESSSAVIWFDMERSLLLPYLLADSELSFRELHPLVRLGVPTLERSPSHVRDVVSSCSEEDIKNFIESEDQSSEGFRRAAVVACLMVRKELGIDAFSSVSRSSDDIHRALGFSSADHFHRTLLRYRKNLSDDIRIGKTPDSYLGVKKIDTFGGAK